MRLGTGRVPPGGWRFEPEAGAEVKGATRELLTQRVFEYRLRRGMPIGDVDRDIDNFYCSRYPGACFKEPHEYQPGASPSPSPEPLVNRVARFAALLMARQPKGGIPIVGQVEAERRGKICSVCPMKQPWRVGCKGCSNSTATLLSQLKRTARTSMEGGLEACSVAGWSNDTAVFMPAVFLEITPEQRSALPEKCWRLSEE